MKIIFGVDAIFPPLTGVGRYAWELARRLRYHPEISGPRFFSHRRWVDDLDALVAPVGATNASMVRRLAVGLRPRLAQRKFFVRAYCLTMPLISRPKLKGFADYLYHSPNFLLPPVAGPAVITVHDLSIYRYGELHPPSRRLLFDLQFGKSLQQASHLITDSEAVRREVIEMFNWAPDRVTAIPLGVDPIFHPRAPADLSAALAAHGLSAGGYTLCVSTVEPRKKIDRLLQAYGALPENLRKQYPLVLAGGRGWLSSGIHDEIMRAEQAGWLKYLGFVDESTLPLLYAGARAFAYPSIYEGFGLPVLEAMASGVPVLTSDQSCLPEVGGAASLLIDPDDIDAFRDGLARLLSDETWRQPAINCGLARAAELSWEACVERTVAIYRQLA